MPIRTVLNTKYDDLTYDEIQNLGEGDFTSVANDMLLEIFKYLPTNALDSVNRTCKQFRHLIRSTEGLIKNSLKIEYPNIQILGPETWGTAAQCEALGIDPTGAPDVDMVELARTVSKFYQKIRIEASITVFPMPRNLTIRKLLEFAQKGPNPVPIGREWTNILNQIGDIPVSRTYLAVMTTGIFIGSISKLFADQKALCQANGGEMPRLIDVLAQSILRFKWLGEKVPLSEPGSRVTMYSRSADVINRFPLIAGFPLVGLDAHDLFNSYDYLGVVGLKKFEATVS